MGCILNRMQRRGGMAISTERCIPNGIQFGEIENISYNIISTLFSNKTTLVATNYTTTTTNLIPLLKIENKKIS